MNQISKPKCDNVTAWPTVTEMHSTPDLSQLVIPTLSPGRSQSPAAQESTTPTPPLLSQEVTASHLVKKKNVLYQQKRRQNCLPKPCPLPSCKNQRWPCLLRCSFLQQTLSNYSGLKTRLWERLSSV